MKKTVFSVLAEACSGILSTGSTPNFMLEFKLFAVRELILQTSIARYRTDRNVGFRTKGIPEVQAAPRTKRKFSPIVPSGRSSKRNKLYSML
jgi:hypothetical protein